MTQFTLLLVIAGGFLVVAAGVVIPTVVLFLTMTRKTIPLPISGTHRIVARDLPFSTLPTRSLDVYAPKPSADLPPLLLFVPGDGPESLIRGAKEWGVFRSHAALAADRGYVAAVISHRSSRNYTDSAGLVADVTGALDALLERSEELGFDKHRVVVWTFSGSAGPVLSHLLSVARPEIRALISFYGVLDLCAYSTRVPLEVVAKYSLPEVLGQLERVPVPVYLVNAGRDQATISAGFHRVVALNRGLTCRNYEKGKHGFELLNPPEEVKEELDRTYAFIAQALG